MTHPDNSARRSPRRGRTARGDRRPWPTAPTITHVSPGKPAESTAGAGRPRGSVSTPTPATVWTADAAPIDLDATWPAALVERIVTSFSEPADQVVLLDWPTPERTRTTLRVLGTDHAMNGLIDHTPGTESDPALADAVIAVERLGRAVCVERVPVDWALVTVPSAPENTATVSVPDAVIGLGDCVGPGADPGAALIVASLPAYLAGGHSADLGADVVALYATRRLRVGGILVVLTHCDWTSGELTDPTGAVVTAGQNADLLYLQHIVALHAPVRDGHFDLTDIRPDGQFEGVHNDRQTDEGAARAGRRARVRGLPDPHQRIHSDVLVFAQPHDHRPPPAALSAPVDPVSRPEDLR